MLTKAHAEYKRYLPDWRNPPDESRRVVCFKLAPLPLPLPLVDVLPLAGSGGALRPPLEAADLGTGISSASSSSLKETVLPTPLVVLLFVAYTKLYKV